VGEFVAVRSTSGDALEMQTRQGPLGTLRTVSVNTAVAFRIGTTKVELTLAGARTQTRVNGELLTVPPGERSLPGGGTLIRRPSDIGAEDGYDVRWPDGSEA